MAIREEHGEGKFRVNDGSGNVETRDLSWTVITLAADYKAPEGSNIPEGTRYVLVYEFEDEKGGKMVGYDTGTRIADGLVTSESLEPELDNLRRSLTGEPEKEIVRDANVGDLGVETHSKDEEFNVYKKLGIDIHNEVTIYGGVADVDGRTAKWTRYRIGERYAKGNDTEIAGVPLSSVVAIDDYRFTDELGGQAIRVTHKGESPIDMNDVCLEQVFAVLSGYVRVPSGKVDNVNLLKLSEYEKAEINGKGQEVDVAQMLGL
ncbi:hypothetical protein KY360_04860 [Candidatus Woesearchaeota archaeon]|nr:hypothetical protein [Candidatus Woesearchaeota archaeon]